MAGASLTRDGPASDPGSYLALPDKGLRRQSFTALETAAAALEALQSTIASAETAVPEKWRDSNPAERPARSRKTSLAVAAQLPAGLKLCSSCRKVKPHALYHACKAKRDGLQDRCKACRAELDRVRLQQTRSITAATTAGLAATTGRPRPATTATRVRTTPVRPSSGSPQRRPGKSSTGGSVQRSTAAAAETARASADASNSMAAAALVAVAEERTSKRRRYPQWGVQKPLQPQPQLPELPTLVPRQRRSGPAAAGVRRCSEPTPRMTEGGDVLAPAVGAVRPCISDHNHKHAEEPAVQLLQESISSEQQHQRPPSLLGSAAQRQAEAGVQEQMQLWHEAMQRQAIEQAQQALQHAEAVQEAEARRVRHLQAQLQAQQLAHNLASQHVQQRQALTAELRRQQLAQLQELLQMQRGRLVLGATLMATTDLASPHLRQRFVHALGAPVLTYILLHPPLHFKIPPPAVIATAGNSALSVSAAAACQAARQLQLQQAEQLHCHGSSAIARPVASKTKQDLDPSAALMEALQHHLSVTRSEWLYPTAVAR